MVAVTFRNTGWSTIWVSRYIPSCTPSTPPRPEDAAASSQEACRKWNELSSIAPPVNATLAAPRYPSTTNDLFSRLPTGFISEGEKADLQQHIVGTTTTGCNSTRGGGNSSTESGGELNLGQRLTGRNDEGIGLPHNTRRSGKLTLCDSLGPASSCRRTLTNQMMD